jgi:hypothetical protein
MARRKRGKPRSLGKLKKCPKCGNLGYPVIKVHRRNYGKREYRQRWFQHYSREMFKQNPRYRMKCCYIGPVH